jgi:hypothetical protein
MTIQAGQKVTAAYKVQSALGSAASGSGGTGIRYSQGTPGMEYERTTIENDESRSDGMSTKGRLGSGRSNGSYTKNLMVGDSNDWIEAILRGTFVAETTLTEASGSLTSITTTTSTIVNGGGSWLTSGVRKGDKVKLGGHSTAANNGKWLRVLNVTASTITVPANSLTLNAVADTSFSLVIAKTCVNGTTERYYTLDQHDQDADITELFTDVKVCKMEIAFQADSNVKITFTLAGLAGAEQPTGASSPVLTSPTYTTTLPLVLSDGTIRINGTDYSVITGGSIVIDCGGQAPATNALNPADVYLDNAKVNGSFTCHKQDSAFFAAHRAETLVDLFFDFVEGNDADPKDFASFYIGNVTLGKASGAMGNTGPRSITVPWFGGKDEAGGANVATMLKYSTSV